MAKTDLKKIADTLIKEIQKNPKLITDFTKDPVKFVEKKTGLDLPDEQINKLIDNVKKNAIKNIDMDKVGKGIELIGDLLKKTK